MHLELVSKAEMNDLCRKDECIEFSLNGKPIVTFIGRFIYKAQASLVYGSNLSVLEPNSKNG